MPMPFQEGVNRCPLTGPILPWVVAQEVDAHLLRGAGAPRSGLQDGDRRIEERQMKIDRMK